MERKDWGPCRLDKTRQLGLEWGDEQQRYMGVRVLFLPSALAVVLTAPLEEMRLQADAWESLWQWNFLAQCNTTPLGCSQLPNGNNKRYPVAIDLQPLHLSFCKAYSLDLEALRSTLRNCYTIIPSPVAHHTCQSSVTSDGSLQAPVLDRFTNCTAFPSWFSLCFLHHSSAEILPSISTLVSISIAVFRSIVLSHFISTNSMIQ
jgi:hypothetical protein